MEPTDFESLQKKKTIPLDKLEDEEEEEVIEDDEDDMSIWDITLLDGLEDEE
jgi:hypothetical protein